MLETLTAVVLICVVVLSVTCCYCLGHFVIGELVGARVRQVEVGIGPGIATFTLVHTTFVLRIVPLMGKVEFFGEFLENETFEELPAIKRLLVITAGPACTFLLGCLVFSIAISTYGRPVPGRTTEVGSVVEGSPAAQAGVMRGDLVAEVDGSPVSQWDTLKELIRQKGETPVALTLIRDGAPRRVRLTPVAEVEPAYRVSPLVPDSIAGIEQVIEREGFGPLAAVGQGITEAARVVPLIFRVLGGLVTGEGSPRDILGQPPVVVGRRPSGEALLYVYAMVAVNLGVLNLLPIMPLNGGQAVVIVFEGLRGRRLKERTKERLLLAGFVVLMILMLMVIYRDLTRIEWINNLLPWR